MNSRISEEEDFCLSDLIEDHTAEVPVDAATRMLLNEAVNRALSELREREQAAVRLRFGLDTGGSGPSRRSGRSSASPGSGFARSR